MAISKPVIVLYTRSDPEDAQALRLRLLQKGVHFQEVEIDKDPGAAEYLRIKSKGEPETPTLIMGNGLYFLVDPSEEELDSALRRMGHHFGD